METTNQTTDTISVSFIGIIWPMVAIAILIIILLAFALTQGFTGNPTNINPTFSLLPQQLT